jgi:uridine kinase
MKMRPILLKKNWYLQVYVDTDDDVRLARRIQRDVGERGRDVAGACVTV